MPEPRPYNREMRTPWLPLGSCTAWWLCLCARPASASRPSWRLLGWRCRQLRLRLARGLPLPRLEPAVLQAYLDTLAVSLSAVQVKLFAWLSGCQQPLCLVVPSVSGLMRGFTGL